MTSSVNLNALIMKNSLSNEDLANQAKSLIKDKYKAGKHHVACILLCNENVYEGLHIDTDGIDTCAEPTAIAAAVLAGETNFDKIVSAYWSGNENEEPTIVSPCGNCRQTLFDIASEIQVIVPDADGVSIRSIEELYPSAYQKPR